VLDHVPRVTVGVAFEFVLGSPSLRNAVAIGPINANH
jgi:hypothetical protein